MASSTVVKCERFLKTGIWIISLIDLLYSVVIISICMGECGESVKLAHLGRKRSLNANAVWLNHYCKKYIHVQGTMLMAGRWHFHYRPTAVRRSSQKAIQDAFELAESYFREHPHSYASQQAAPVNITWICWYSDSINISLVSYKALLL